MELEGIDGTPVFVRAADIVIVSTGHIERPSPLVKATTPNGLRLANGAAGTVTTEPTVEKIGVLILCLRGVAQDKGVKDTASNREKIEKALAA